MRTQYNDLLTSISGTLMRTDRTGFEQFHHINYHIKRTGGGDNDANRDFLAGARCTLSASWQAFLFSVSLPHPDTFDHFFLSSYRCDTILDSVYRCTVHVRNRNDIMNSCKYWQLNLCNCPQTFIIILIITGLDSRGC